jgi:hypothetical protein
MQHIINQYSDNVLGNASQTAYLGYCYTNRAEKKTCYKCTTEPVNIYTIEIANSQEKKTIEIAC